MQPHTRQQIEAQRTSWGQGCSPTFVVNSLPLRSNSAPLWVTPLPLHMSLTPEEHLGVKLDHKQVIIPLGHSLQGTSTLRNIENIQTTLKTRNLLLEQVMKMIRWFIVWPGQFIPWQVCKSGPSFDSRCTENLMDDIQLMNLVITLEHGLFGEKFQHDTPKRIQSFVCEIKLKHHQKAYPALHISTSGP